MKKYYSILVILTLAFITGCKKEYAPPVITAPQTTSVEIKKTVDLSFSFNAEGGYSSATVTATGGTAVIKTYGTEGATSGTITVSFSAGTNVGAGAVTLTLSDSKNQSATATAVINVEGVPTISVSKNIDANTTWEQGKIYTGRTHYSAAGVQHRWRNHNQGP